ncbi:MULTISPECIES: ABC transporter permease [unclassified Mycoplasma]|uniref:ABC transporter permease n=1 Tax=unclassified Mycoplasma TaxID=2683645 RepID=UPI00211BDFFE|nr:MULTISPECIES: ABC transporter permease [unclassified Mycoplasma]UUM19812.1 hypothetical protein NPA11_03550 [Mycoplasma sp. 1578d]UUM24796.1 hypothetical protein NPA12_03825 [Mycoplasma sp. 3686d]
MSTYILFRRQFISLWNQKFRFFFSLIAPIFIFVILLLIFNLVSLQRGHKSLLARDNFQIGTGLIFLITIINGSTLTVIQIQDNYNNAINDIKVTPIKHWKIRYSYFLFNFAINFITTFLTFIIFIFFILGFNVNEIKTFNSKLILKSIASETIDSVASLIKYIKEKPELSAQYGNNADQILKSLEAIYSSTAKEPQSSLFTYQIINILNWSTMFNTFLLMICGTLFASLLFPIVLSRLRSLNISQALNIMLILFGGYFIGSFIPLAYYPSWLRSFCSIIPTTHLLQITRHSLYVNTLNQATNISLNPISLLDHNISVAWSLIYVLSWILCLFWINIFIDKVIQSWRLIKYFIKLNLNKIKSQIKTKINLK